MSTNCLKPEPQNFLKAHRIETVNERSSDDNSGQDKSSSQSQQEIKVAKKEELKEEAGNNNQRYQSTKRYERMLDHKKKLFNET